MTWLALLRLWLRIGGSPLSAIGARLLARAIRETPIGSGFEIRGAGRWWDPIRVHREPSRGIGIGRVFVRPVNGGDVN